MLCSILSDIFIYGAVSERYYFLKTWIFSVITEVWLVPPTEVFFFSDLLLQLPARSLEPLELSSLCTSLPECFWFQPAQGRHRDTNILSLPEYCMVLLTTSAPRHPTVIVRYGSKYQWAIFKCNLIHTSAVVPCRLIGQVKTLNCLFAYCRIVQFIFTYVNFNH